MDLDRQLQASLGDNFELERELEAGGMARVFVAREIALDRRVVVKVLPPEMSTVVLAKRFRREISLAAQLRHPHIVPLLTAGEAGELLYYTMPFVEGETLRARIRSGDPISAGEGIRIIREIAYALSYAHRHGIVHRDIKPENVLLENGHAVVADFGVAKALVNAAAGDESSTSPTTTAGMTIGTVTYMAPEQAAADPATDHRADLYALGVVAYEIFVGIPPFAGSPHQVIASHMVEQAKPLSAQRPDLPSAVTDVVMQLLAKNPGDRPENADAVVSTLDAVIASGDSSASRVTPTNTRRTNARAVGVAAIVIAVLAAAYGGYRLVDDRKTSAGPTTQSGGDVAGARVPEAKTVAVLPFSNTSGDAENEHFANGLTDELIGALGQVHGLKVSARTSVFALKGRGLSAREIAEMLGVATVIEGSARRDGNRLKVTAHVVSAADGSVLWSETFDRELIDVFAVQEEIARAIVRALHVGLIESERSALAGRPTRNLDAYDLYLKGRYAWSRTGRGREGMETALGYLQNAVELDPQFALPYAAIAEVYVVMSNYNFIPVRDALGKAQTAADRALALDPSLPEAHTAKGYVLLSHRRFTEAEMEFRRAIDLNPSHAQGHHFYSLMLMMVGRTDEAAVRNRLALSLDPLFVVANANRGVILAQQGKHDDARRELEKALPLSGENTLAPLYLGMVEAATGRFSKALPHLERADRITPGFPGVKGALAYTYSRTGARAKADSILEQARSVTPMDDRSRIQLAFALAVNGDLNGAYQLLGAPVSWDVPSVLELRADPLLAAFRADSRYPGLLARIGLTP